MIYPLKLFGGSEPKFSFEAAADRRQDRLFLAYELLGDLSELVLASPPFYRKDMDEFEDGVWFEAFVKPSDSQEYQEYCFAPSGEIYTARFSNYRERKQVKSAALRYAQRVDAKETHYRMAIALALPESWCKESLQLGLSAILKKQNGESLFFAHSHSEQKPDFHNVANWTIRL